MKYLFYPMILLASIMLAACSEDVVESLDENIPIDQKSEIAFTLSAPGLSGQTRADGTTHGFATATEIVARYESYKSSSVNTVPEETAEKRTSRTVLKAEPEASGAGYSDVNYLNDDYRRYWDDAYSRLGYLSIYAIAVPGKPNTLTNNSKTLLALVHEGSDVVSTSNVNWKKNDNGADANDVAWIVSLNQTDETLANEDLCYSNNIQKTGKDGRYVWDFETSAYKPAKTGQATHADGQMHIALQNASDKTSTGHFDRGHLVFNHALTRLTVNLRKGTGFKTTDPADPFKFADGTNVKILGVPTSSKLNIKTGAWLETPSASEGITTMHQYASASTGYDYSLQSQFIPGFVINKDDNTPVLEYTIDDNVYSITQAQIFTALKDKTNSDGSSVVSSDAIEMKQGKNYVLNIVVNKTSIASVTASLINWEYINADEIAPENHYITITDMMSNTDDYCKNFDLYRVNDDVDTPYTGTDDVPAQYNWFKHYTDKATLNQVLDASNNPTNIWKTNWYWESNKSFYHFRTVNKNTQIKAGTDATDPKDYFEVTSGQLVDSKDAAGFNDYHWGAPMKDGVTMKYDITEGYNGEGKNFIYPAIGSTTSTIHLIEHHMMSNVHIVLHTPTKTDAEHHVLVVAENGVTLKDGTTTTTVELNRFYKDGTVEMARGVVNPVTNDESMTESAGIDAPSTYFTKSDIKIEETTYNVDDVGQTNKYSYRVVPQSLNRGTDPAEAGKIGLTITTPDGNKYYVPELAIIKAVTGTNTLHHNANEAVTRWYPGYDYTYHINLKKTGIESITCTIVDWVKVETGSIDIGL